MVKVLSDSTCDLSQELLDKYIVLYLQLTKYRKLTNDLWSPSFRNLLKVVILLGFLPLYVASSPAWLMNF